MFSILPEDRGRPVDSPDVRLMNAIGFTDEDLEANRLGVVTEAQRKQIQSSSGCLEAGLCLLAIAFVIYGVFELKDAALIGVMVVFAIMSVGSALWIHYQTQKVLRDNTVASVTGRLTRSTYQVHTGRTYATKYQVTVQGKKFHVEKRAYEAFTNGRPYTLYYMPQTQQLLSVKYAYAKKKQKGQRKTDKSSPENQ
jgi:hypothetical protein